MKRISDSGNDSNEEESETPLRKRPNVVYKKLVIPVRMRSIYWKFFGFPADENQKIITKDAIVCTLCKRQMVYNRNTSNLRTHLRCRHKELITKIEREAGITSGWDSLFSVKNDDEDTESESVEYSVVNVLKAEKPSTSRRRGKDIPTIVVSEEGNENDNDLANISIIFPNGEELLSFAAEKQAQDESTDSIEISNIVMNCIITDLISPELVNGSGFHRLMSSLSKRTVLIPSMDKIITELIPNIHAATREHIQTAMISGEITNLSLSMEEWTSKNGMTYLSVYVHYLRSGFTALTTKLLGTILGTGVSTASEWGFSVEKLLSEWNLNFQVISAVLVAFSIPALSSYLNSKNLVQIPCFMALLEKICSGVVFELPSVKDMLRKCRLAVTGARTINVTREDCDSDDHYDEYSSHIFGFDKPGSWLTTYYMLNGLLLRQNKIIEQSSGTNKCPLNSSDWTKLRTLKEVLEPLQTVAKTFFEEKCPVSSLLCPLLGRVLNNVFEPQDNDAEFVAEIRRVFKSHFEKAFANDDVRSFTDKATLLDPRFKDFVERSINNGARKELGEALIQLVNTEGLITDEEFSSSELIPSTTKKPRRLSGMNMLFSNLKVKKETRTIEDRAQNEITFFESESNTPLEQCPLQWWESRMNKYPNLFRLARKYLCVPAMVLINRNDCILDRLKFYEKRANLKSEIVDALLFLHLNNDL